MDESIHFLSCSTCTRWYSKNRHTTVVHQFTISQWTLLFNVTVLLWPLVDKTGTQQLHLFSWRLNADEQQAAGSQNHSTPEWWKDFMSEMLNSKHGQSIKHFHKQHPLQITEHGSHWLLIAQQLQFSFVEQILLNKSPGFIMSNMLITTGLIG